MKPYTAVSAEEAVSVVRSGQRVFVHSAAAAPEELLIALTKRAPELREVEICQLHTEGSAPYAQPGMEAHFRVNAMFIGANVRGAVQDGRADYVPIFLSEIPGLFRKGILPIDVALIQVSPPDKHGYCSLGTSVDVTRAALESAHHIIALVNPRMPRSHGDGILHWSKIHRFVETDRPLFEHRTPEPGPQEQKIGELVANLIEDGSTLQMGIGTIPDAVLKYLGGHSHLGIHTEMFSDGILPLVEKGVITGSRKKVHPGKIVSGFSIGTQKLYDFIHDNPMVNMLDIAYVNDVTVIRRNPQAVSINSALEVDLTGQVCADSIGTKFYSGVGGQMDFIRGASLSEGGKPIIALPSATKKGQSKIVPILRSGAGVVTTRAHVHYVATEYGIADLHGKNIRQRVKAMIEIAHPDFREELEREAHSYYHL